MLSLGLGFKTLFSQHECGCVFLVIPVPLRDAVRSHPFMGKEISQRPHLKSMQKAWFSEQQLAVDLGRPVFRSCLFPAMALDVQADSQTSFSL